MLGRPCALAVAVTGEPRRMAAGTLRRATLTCTVPLWADTVGVISRTKPWAWTLGSSSRLTITPASLGGATSRDS
ncbi:hypothetical protein D3C75_1040680 [compost metagenome]